MTDLTDLTARFHAAPVDAGATSELAAHELTVSRVDLSSRHETERWQDAVARGFLNDEPDDKQHEGFAVFAAPSRRKIGVYDAAGPQPDLPVATFASWITELTVPGGALPATAISAVTVAPTHRRRGILRSVMAGELRTAAELGVPIAALTVSESTIYGRFGFGAAAASAQWEISARRARWIGPDAPGRIDFITREDAQSAAAGLHERVRLSSPGEIAMPGGHWQRFFGTRPDADKPGRLRAVQYRSAGGDVDGVALYTVTENHDDFTLSSIDVSLLLADGDEAYAGLWRFLLSLDLVGTVRASELSVDEPLWWMIADQRAAQITIRDHQYLRILDVPRALAARRYDTGETVAFEVTDPLGIAGGTFVLTTDPCGVAAVEVVPDPPLGIPLVRLGVTELSALLLGGVSVISLARAGRVQTDEPERLSRLFQTAAAPRLSFWY